MRLPKLPALLLAAAALAPSASAQACPTLIQGDMNNDGVCNIVDAILFNTAWTMGNLRADWNFDCQVDVSDIVRFYLILGPTGTSAHTIMDYNLDGSRNFADFIAYLADWNAGISFANVTMRYANQWDCFVDIADLNAWALWFFTCP